MVASMTFGVHSNATSIARQASRPYCVTPITRCLGTASFFWIQNLIRDTRLRVPLFDIDASIMRLMRDVSDHDDFGLSSSRPNWASPSWGSPKS
jgi:predicted 2-oxoglutarate/Fe(II)-dependent dioxygenase YbiX